MLLSFQFVFFIITFAKASRNAIKNKKSNSCVAAINEFEYEDFVYSIIFNTSTVSLKCPTTDLVGTVHIPSIVTKPNLSKYSLNQNDSQNFTVVKIQNDCFRDQEHLTSVSLPETITEIGQFSFFNCVSLTSFHFPSNMNDVPQSCFYGCINLESITLPLNAVSVADYSFFNCELLRYFKLPDSIQSIGSYAFSYCRCIVNTLEVPLVG